MNQQSQLPADNNTINEIASHIEAILRLIGEDPEREGLVKTPLRAARAIAFLTKGYSEDADAMMRQAMFTHEGSRVVVVRDIEFYSLCEHHVLPFFGKVTIGYIPDGKIVGLSKLARVVNAYARRLQVQERFTAQLCKAVERVLGAKGVMVICQGEHLCMKMRGVEKQGASTTTVEYTGAFADDPALRAEVAKCQ